MSRRRKWAHRLFFLIWRKYVEIWINFKKSPPLKGSSSIVRFWWVLKFITYDLQIKDAITQLSLLSFFEGGCIYVRKLRLLSHCQLPPAPTQPTPCATLSFCLSLMDLLTSFLPIVVLGEDFTLLSSWPFCGVCTAVWKTTQKWWFETKTVIYFAHS